MVTNSRAHVFVIRGDEILVLQQALGGWWEQPGGELLPGENPTEAAVRETLEETGIRIATPILLRNWTYKNRSGVDVRCYAFVADADSGEVVLSDEHVAFEWMTADEYAQRYCSESVAARAPAWVQAFLSEMRRNCSIFTEWRAGDLTSPARPRP